MRFDFGVTMIAIEDLAGLVFDATTGRVVSIAELVNWTNVGRFGRRLKSYQYYGVEYVSLADVMYFLRDTNVEQEVSDPNQFDDKNESTLRVGPHGNEAFTSALPCEGSSAWVVEESDSPGMGERSVVVMQGQATVNVVVGNSASTGDEVEANDMSRLGVLS